MAGGALDAGGENQIKKIAPTWSSVRTSAMRRVSRFLVKNASFDERVGVGVGTGVGMGVGAKLIGFGAGVAVESGDVCCWGNENDPVVGEKFPLTDSVEAIVSGCGDENGVVVVVRLRNWRFSIALDPPT